MEDNQTKYLYRVVINKWNENEVLDVLHVIADDYLHATVMVDHHVFEGNMFPNIPVEVSKIERVMDVKKILNNFVYPDFASANPFDISNASPDDVIKFKHTCSNIITVVDNGWDEVFCPDCKKLIKRSNLENIAGTWVYTG